MPIKPDAEMYQCRECHGIYCKACKDFDKALKATKNDNPEVIEKATFECVRCGTQFKDIDGVVAHTDDICNLLQEQKMKQRLMREQD